MKALICPRCNQGNPPEASYCHHDGVLLEGVKAAQKAKTEFPTPFIFKSGLSCPDFKSLGRGILAEWNDSRDMLAFAEWEAFFNGLGRLDLVQIASQARSFPDPDLGLDQLLNGLPGFEANPGALRINQRTLDFGLLQTGVQGRATIRLENNGDRLVWGEAILKDAPWCSLSSEGSLSDRSFRYINSLNLEVIVPSENIRRSGRALTGTMIIKTESEELTIQLLAKEPDVIPFEGDLFHGSTSPRQIAEKSKTKPREAVPLFLSGKVAKWYEVNGWTYPVTGPTAPGMASVQQYFEAHGFAPAPKVEIEPQAFFLQSVPGEPVEQRLVIKTQDKRHVFGYLLPTETWVRVGDLEPNYQMASIILIFETQHLSNDAPLRTVLTLIANGQQRFEIPVEIQAKVPESPMLDLDSLATPIDESEMIDLAPVELLEGEVIDVETNLMEATFVSTQPQIAKILPPQTNDGSVNSTSIQNQSLEKVAVSVSPSPIAQSTDPKPTPSTIIENTTPSLGSPGSVQPAIDASADKTSLEKAELKPKSPKKGKKILLLGGIASGIILLTILAIALLWGGGRRTGGKEFIRPLIAGKQNTDLLSFTVETIDQDRVSLLATEASDTGSHFMLKSNNSTASVNSKKSFPRLIAKWETKDAWSHREIELTVGGNKWRIGQWLQTLRDNPKQCAVLYELSPIDRDSKISARLALRPGTGTGNSVDLFLADSEKSFKKPILLKGDKLPDKLLFNIESPPTNGVLGLDVPEIILPGREKPTIPAKPTQLLIGQGLESFSPWDCQFPELFDDSPEIAPPIVQKGGQPKNVEKQVSLKDPFISLYWDDATVRKGQKRLIGFTLGIANQEGPK